MIVGILENSNIYYKLGEKIEKGFKYMKENNLLEMDCGIYEIEGSDIFVSIEEYNGKNIEDCLWEAHKKYIDIQYIIRGKEKIGYMDSEKMNITIEYNDKRDIFFGKGRGKFLTLNEGEYAIFTPNDAHMPSIKVNENGIKKAVVKVAI